MEKSFQKWGPRKNYKKEDGKLERGLDLKGGGPQTPLHAMPISSPPPPVKH